MALFALMLATPGGCSEVPVVCERGECINPDGGMDSTIDGSADAPPDSIVVVDGHPCDTSKSPKDEPCVADDQFAIFVSPDGADSNAGTKGAPKKTLAAGIDVARSANKRVIACAGTFPENIIVDAAKSGARVHGGFSCTTWSFDAGVKTLIQPSTGLPLKIDGVTSFLLEDVSIEAPNASAEGASSIGVFVSSSQGVVLRRVAVKSGDGAKGANGQKASNYDETLQADNTLLIGSNASGSQGGIEKDCVSLCTDNVRSTGGRGGAGGLSPTDGGNGAPARGAGQGGTVNECISSIGGKNGGDGAPGAGGAGATVAGQASASGWTPADGTGGQRGGPGQGGGGGGGKAIASNGGGAGGGCGGCGGGGASAGGGGGSSFAILSWESTVTLDACDLRAGAANDGGKGGDGQGGQVGGFSGTQATGGCQGGTGGRGGAGGGGGGGAGGLSVAIAYKGSFPVELNSTQKQIGTAGVGGAPGSGGNPSATKGLDGEAAPTKALP